MVWKLKKHDSYFFYAALFLENYPRHATSSIVKQPARGSTQPDNLANEAANIDKREKQQNSKKPARYTVQNSIFNAVKPFTYTVSSCLLCVG